MASARDLRSGDEVELLSGETVVLVADPCSGLFGRLTLEYESVERLPNGMATKVGVILGVRPDEGFMVSASVVILSQAA